MRTILNLQDELVDKAHKLTGIIGYVDAHLLAAVALTPGAALWTRDMRLASLARTLGLARSPIG